jgi:ABC-type lipoprotein export system ATPase subunit
MIEIKDLHKSYRTGSTPLHVLKGINFNVEKGELVENMFSSASGKSTLINILRMPITVSSTPTCSTPKSGGCLIPKQ